MLIDSNIFLEIARNQEYKQDCKDLINAIEQESISEEAYITKFSLDAIKAMASKESPKLVRLILIMIHQDKLKVLDTKPEDDLLTLGALQNLKLDFDDATQFVAANKLGTYLVTFDKDFKKTGLQIKTPKEVLKEILIH